MNETPLFTVIIPHYNRPQLLERCLASIPDIPDVQVIVVDDNSASEIVDFDHFPGSLRVNTTIIYNKENKGAGHARNLALPHALGKWLIFADADDYFTEDAWICFQQNIESKADIIYFGITSVDSETLQNTDRYKTYDKYVQTYVKYKTKSNEEWLRFRHDVPWGKMIRRELVLLNSIQFDNTKYCNDTIFSTLTAINAKMIDGVSNAVYCVTDCKNSLTTQMTADAILIRYKVILRKNKILREYNHGKYQLSVRFYFRQALELRCSPRVLLKMFVWAIKWRTNLFVNSQLFKEYTPN